jgi:hypothetical protein
MSGMGWGLGNAGHHITIIMTMMAKNCITGLFLKKANNEILNYEL